MPMLPAFDMVLFGGTGDLVMRKLLPALYHQHQDGMLNKDSRVIAVAPSDMSRADFQALAEKHCSAFLGAAFDRPTWLAFIRRLHYLQLDANDASSFTPMQVLLDEAKDRVRVFYLSTSPALFTPICAHLSGAGLITTQSRIVPEKPLGHDLQSSREINDVIGEYFSEQQIFRIDHYLGKEPVQNLLALRFGNALFEPLWRRESIANIQITLAEGLGVGTRGDYYDKTGALRDMVQNHALQLLTMIAMEPPSSSDADAIRDEKLKVLKSLKPFTPDSVARDVVRGQYRAGTVDGKAVVGYADEVKVPSGSTCETFVALRTEVQNWRWAGVPFYLRTGKRLAARDAQIVVNFRPTPHSIFPGVHQPNKLVIKLQPEDGLELHLLGHKTMCQ